MLTGQQDEGIVQPGSKDSDRLSRRLHHYEALAGLQPALFAVFYMHEIWRDQATAIRSCTDIAALVDGEGTITLIRENRNENREARGPVEQISPFRRSCKAARAKRVLDGYVDLTPRNGRYGAGPIQARTEFEKRPLALRP